MRGLGIGIGVGFRRGRARPHAPVMPGNLVLTAGTGYVTITGEEMTPIIDFRLPAETASVAVTGQAATLTKGGGVASPAYVYCGLDNVVLGGTVQTATIDTGTASADRRVVVILSAQNANTIVSVVVNGVSLTARSFDNSFETSAIYDGLVTTGNGTNGGNNVVVTWGTNTFQAVQLQLWTLTGLASGYVNSAAFTTNYGANVSVTAGDILLTEQRISTPGDYSTSTQLPFGVHSDGSSGTGMNGADWTIASTNASFQIRHNGGGGSNGAWGLYR